MKKKTKKTAAQKKSPSSKAKQTNRKSPLSQDDIVSLILQDHKPLKELIETMKDSETSVAKRLTAFEKFAPLLILHAKSEEKALYAFLKKNEELREDGFEGVVEHSLAEEMLQRVMDAPDEDQKGACIKILAELVEHHVEEEETDMLPRFKKEVEASERAELGQQYLQFKSDLEGEDVMDNLNGPSSTSRDRAQVHA